MDTGWVFPAPGTAYTPAEQERPPSGALTVVHADAAFLVVDKPAYLTVENTVSNKDSVRSRLEAAGHARLHLAHRLDWETSGLLVVALDAAAASALSQQFAGRSAAKVYVADCVATPPAATTSCSAPILAVAANASSACVSDRMCATASRPSVSYSGTVTSACRSHASAAIGGVLGCR